MARLQHELPVVGSWYFDVDHSDRFEIVALDEKEGTIELQYFEGEIEEIDPDTWYGMRVVSIAPPKDWSGPFEVDREEFFEYKTEVHHPTEGHNPLDSFE